MHFAGVSWLDGLMDVLVIFAIQENLIFLLERAFSPENLSFLSSNLQQKILNLNALDLFCS